MLRGRRSIFLSLFENETNFNDGMAPLPERKGRNEALHNKRNELLIHRYYYHTRLAGRQYPEVLIILEQNEFFISQRTIVDTIQAHGPLLSHLNGTKPQLKFFKEKFPFMSW